MERWRRGGSDLESGVTAMVTYALALEPEPSRCTIARFGGRRAPTRRYRCVVADHARQELTFAIYVKTNEAAVDRTWKLPAARDERKTDRPPRPRSTSASVSLGERVIDPTLHCRAAWPRARRRVATIQNGLAPSTPNWAMLEGDEAEMQTSDEADEAAGRLPADRPLPLPATSSSQRRLHAPARRRRIVLRPVSWLCLARGRDGNARFLAKVRHSTSPRLGFGRSRFSDAILRPRGLVWSLQPTAARQHNDRHPGPLSIAS